MGGCQISWKKCHVTLEWPLTAYQIQGTEPSDICFTPLLISQAHPWSSMKVTPSVVCLFTHHFPFTSPATLAGCWTLATVTIIPLSTHLPISHKTEHSVPSTHSFLLFLSCHLCQNALSPSVLSPFFRTDFFALPLSLSSVTSSQPLISSPINFFYCYIAPSPPSHFFISLTRTFPNTLQLASQFFAK